MSDTTGKKTFPEQTGFVSTTHVGSDSSRSQSSKSKSGELNRQSKRPRIIIKDGDSKPTASAENEHLPLAPTLQEYLSDGGHLRYLPRPEWCCSSNYSHVDAEHYAYSDSSQPSQRPAPRDRRQAFGPMAEMFGFGDAYENETEEVFASNRRPGEMLPSMSYDLNDDPRQQIAVSNMVTSRRINDYCESDDASDVPETRDMVSLV